MRELRYLEVDTAKRIRNLRVGSYTSPQRGPGFDFDEHQAYRYGDDVRRIDWNVTARMNAPFVRHTHAEREMNLMLAIDVSRSMRLGTGRRSKREVMTLMTASLLFSAVADQINTGFLAFADAVVEHHPPRRSRAAAWAVLERCWELSPSPGRTALLPAIRHLFGGAELGMLAAKHDAIAVVPLDPAEDALPEGRGYMRVRDTETGRDAAVALSPRTRREYAAEMRARREALATAFHRVPMDHVFVPTDGNPVEPLMSLFAARMAR